MGADKRYADPPACHNCGSPLYGRFCSNCGQEHLERSDRDRRLFRAFIFEQFNFDKRIFRTLLGLLWPGYLTTEYLAGRRGRYVTPFKTYLYISVAMFTVLAFTGQRQSLMGAIQSRAEREFADSTAVAESSDVQSTDNVAGAVAPGATAAPTIGASAERGPVQAVAPELPAVLDSPTTVRTGDTVLAAGLGADSTAAAVDRSRDAANRIVIAADRSLSPDSGDADAEIDTTGLLYRLSGTVRGGFTRMQRAPGAFYQRLFKRMAQGMFVLMPILALLLKALYERSRRGYVEHLILSLNFHSFTFLVVIFLQALYLIGGRAMTLANPGVLLLVPAYLLLAMKRCYGQGIVKTTVKFALLTASYGMIFAAGMAVVLYLALAAA
ncbi:MAG: DUF3667 domain-containing protein [Candidatus Edwardsbacteria bacterium]|jgi:hypothetical protein|nr:DUF3667 domain-containing protein [Candidatus Edwardsbacteria bacterium]